MAARDKRGKAVAADAGPEPPRLTQSGRAVKSRPPADAESEPQPSAAVAASPAPGEAPKLVRKRGRPMKRRPGGAAAPPDDDSRPSPTSAKTRNSKRLEDDAGAKKKGPAITVALKKKRAALLAKKAAKRPLVKRPPPAPVAPKPKPDPEDGQPSPAPAVEIKREPDTSESPLAAFDSRSSSPRSLRKRRTSSDLLLVMNTENNLVEGMDAVFDSQQPSQKLLRNGKRRSLKDALLDEEAKKRRRLVSESPDLKQSETPDKITVPVIPAEADPDAETADSKVKAEDPPPEEALAVKLDASHSDDEDQKTESAEDPPSAEKLNEKSLILDNMSKTFNDPALSDKAKSIRRSTRKRKSTTKAKENEETVFNERDASDVEDKSASKESKRDSDSSFGVSKDTGEEKPDSKPEDLAPPEGVDESAKENLRSPPYVKSFTDQDFDKIIDRLKCFEEQDRKRQEEQSKLNSRPVMVTNDVVLIPKSNVEHKTLKDISASLSKEKENVFNGSDVNANATVKRDQVRRSFDIDLPSGVTLIKRSGSATRNRSAGSLSKDDAVTVFDKCLGKEVTLDIRKSIDKGIISIEAASKVPLGTQITVTTKNHKSAVKEIDNSVEKESSLEIISLPPVVSQSVTAASLRLPPDTVVTSLSDTIVETPEKQKEKEEILKTLGLLTLKAANQAKIDKEKQKELIKSSKNSVPKYANSEGYTGTLKTVIKLNRSSPDKKKGRTPLKMTFQKSKNRSSKFFDNLSGDSESDENPYYTIHKEFGGSSGSGTGSSDHMMTGGHRKTHYSNRFNNNESGLNDQSNDIMMDSNSGKEPSGSLVIPEKASSFGIHPGRLCQDQCYYCGGKFGLFDTPCHIAQIKSSERQKKILDNEEKLTVDSCLCDACYRHVDRRANCPSYRKRTLPGTQLSTAPTLGDTCFANSCDRPAPHTLRRKWLVKMKRNVAKVVQLELDYPGLHTIPLCSIHYQAISQLMVCGLCKRRLSRNHIHCINQEYKSLNAILRQLNIPVTLDEKPVVCKSCRYFSTLLLRPPPANESNKHAFLKSHRRRLRQAYNIDVPDDSDTDNTDEMSANPELNNDQSEVSKEKKRGKNGKSKSKKPADGNKLSDENCLNNTQSRNSSGKGNHRSIIPKNMHSSKMILEDMESLISSNKILVPGLSGQTSGVTSINVGDSNVVEYDNPLIAELDKRSEFNSILQNCNVPSSTILQKITDSHKSKNILKVHNSTASNKGSHNQKKLNRSERRIQKLGQIVAHKNDFEETLGTKIPNRDEFTIEPMNSFNDERGVRDNSANILRNIALNDECTIETIPSRPSKNLMDINSLKSKWVMTESFSQVKRNLSALSKNHSAEQMRKKGINQNDSYSNPVQRLETNPSISVRELFPGEEEMNLHCNIEFGNLKGITPEGWEKCSTTIQYDVQTKNLWQELQKPYGNQSSFLRHLILLEKYFRNGDLILSQFANENAITYSESVQNRLRSYDNLSSGDLSNRCSPVNVSPKMTQVVNPVVPASDAESTKKAENNVDFRKPAMTVAAGKSLLKSNQVSNTEAPKSVKSTTTNKVDPATSTNSGNGKNNDPSKAMPVILTQLEKLGNQLTPIQVPSVPRPSTPRPDASFKVNEVTKTPSLPVATATDPKTSTPKTDAAPQKSKVSSLPPELIAINQTSLHKKNIENVVKNIHLKGSSTPVNPTTQASTPNISSSFSSISPISTNSAKTTKSSTTTVATKDASKKKTKGSSKQWRPTLIPITDESKARNGRDGLHQTADGRRLPSLVQVMSAGKPYFITIQDYNRMCIMRREKLQQEKKDNIKKNQSGGSQNSPSATAVTDVSIEAMPNNSNTQNKSPPPVAVQETEKATTTTTQKQSDPNVANSTGKAEENDDGKNTLTDVNASSLLKNVSLKNVTIAPIPLSNDIKAPVPTIPSQSLLISNAKNQIPQLISQLNTSVSVSAETLANNDIGSLASLTAKVVPQAIMMPKIPKSLTVIPQPVNNNPAATGMSTALVPIIPPILPLTVLPLPPAFNVSAPTLTVSPSEP